MYPNSKEVKFDMDYYKNRHLPLLSKKLGTNLIGLELEFGIAGSAPENTAPYIAIAHLLFKNMASFKTAFTLHLETFAADVNNYSNVKRHNQISEPIPF